MEINYIATLRGDKMSNIGINSSGIPQDVVLGKELAKFGKDIKEKQKADDLAKMTPGSELVYQDEKGNWTVSELKENGVLYGQDDLSSSDRKDIVLDSAKLKQGEISNPVISFVEDQADDQLKIAYAADKNSSKQVLTLLSKDNSPLIRADVAANPSTSPSILSTLAKDDGIDHVNRQQLITRDIQQGVAANPQTPADTLRDLAKDGSAAVRAKVAANRNTPSDVLKSLAWDLDPSVRVGLASNPALGSDLLGQLAKDPDDKVRLNALMNPKVPQEILLEHTKDSSPDIRQMVGVNPSLSKEQLKKLAKEPDLYLKFGIYNNANCPPELRKELKPVLEKTVKNGSLELYAPAIDEKGTPLSTDGVNQAYVKIGLDGNLLVDKDGQPIIRK
jgi:hypothetical protein